MPQYDVKGNTMTPKYNEAPSSNTLGSIVSGILVTVLVNQFPQYSELWVALGAVVAILAGVALKKFNVA